MVAWLTIFVPGFTGRARRIVFHCFGLMARVGIVEIDPRVRHEAIEVVRRECAEKRRGKLHQRLKEILNARFN
jgi:hypothetical protein